MKKILQYSFYEMIRSRWIFIYTGFYILTVIALASLSNDAIKVMISLSNIVLAITPLIGILFGIMYYYNSRDFIQVFLSQPISRWKVFSALYGGLAAALCLSCLIGIGVPLLFLGGLQADTIKTFLLLLSMSMVLSIIFSLISFVIGVRYTDKVKGLSIAILAWLFFAVIYDGIVLLLLMLFRDYPLDKLSIGVLVLNPIDLARILIIMNLDISAMMGYTGAVLSKFLGTTLGGILIVLSLSLWIIIPAISLKKLIQRKDF